MSYSINDVIKLIHISEKFTITQNFHIMICLFPFMFNLGQGQTSFENINVTLETIRFACLKASFIVQEDFITLCSETTKVLK